MSHVSDIIQPQDSVSNAGSSVSQASKSSKAKISALRIKAEFQEKRARQRLEAERQRLEQEHEFERLDIQEELAIAVAEDAILHLPEDSANPRPPLLHAELSSPPSAVEDLGPPILSDPSGQTPQYNPPGFSFHTDRDIVNNMPPPLPASTPPANSATVPSDAIQKVATLSQHSKLPSAEVQVFDGDPCSYQRFLSSFRYVAMQVFVNLE